MRKRLVVMLTVALMPFSGALACQQAVEDRAREEIDRQVQKGQDRLNKELDKGQKRIEKELTNARQQVEEGAKKAQQEAERRAGGGQ